VPVPTVALHLSTRRLCVLWSTADVHMGPADAMWQQLCLALIMPGCQLHLRAGKRTGAMSLR
jgi:hypothetical protein